MATCIPPILERTGAATSNRPRGCDGRRYRDEDPQRLKADGTLQIARLGILRSANGLWVAARLPWELDNRALLRGWAQRLPRTSETTRRVANIKANRRLNIRRRTFAQGHNQGNDVQPLQLSGAEAGCTSGRRASRNRSLPRGLDYEPSSNSWALRWRRLGPWFPFSPANKSATPQASPRERACRRNCVRNLQSPVKR